MCSLCILFSSFFRFRFIYFFFSFLFFFFLFLLFSLDGFKSINQQKPNNTLFFSFTSSKQTQELKGTTWLTYSSTMRSLAFLVVSLASLMLLCDVDAKLSPVGIEMEYYTTSTTGGWTVTTKEQLNSCGYVISSPNAAGYYNTYSFDAPYAQTHFYVYVFTFVVGLNKIQNLIAFLNVFSFFCCI